MFNDQDIDPDEIIDLMQEEIDILREMLLVIAGVHVIDMDFVNKTIIATKIMPPTETIH